MTKYFFVMKLSFDTQSISVSNGLTIWHNVYKIYGSEKSWLTNMKYLIMWKQVKIKQVLVKTNLERC